MNASYAPNTLVECVDVSGNASIGEGLKYGGYYRVAHMRNGYVVLRGHEAGWEKFRFRPVAKADASFCAKMRNLRVQP